MGVDLTLLDSDFVISGIFAFLLGMASMTIYTRLKSIFFEEPRYKANDPVVEATVMEYTRRLCDYDKAIAQLRAKVDIMEMRTQNELGSQHPSQPQPHVASVSEPVTITQHAVTESEVNGTTDYILKLLIERPRTSREVQLAIGRTREHTSRLMKKLHDIGLVNREITTKPFRYNITDVGRERLKERVEAAASVAV
jgi:hypothetical protein